MEGVFICLIDGTTHNAIWDFGAGPTYTTNKRLMSCFL